MQMEMRSFCLVTLAVLISSVSTTEKREAQTQSCVGSQCSQNNLNLSPFQGFQGFGPFGGFGLGLGGQGGFGGGLGEN